MTRRRTGVRTPTLLALFVGLALATASCGDESGSAGGDDVLRDKTFLSTSITEDGKAKQLAPKTRVRLEFTDDGRLLADAGCNSMQSPVKTSGGKLEVEDMAMTGIGCDPARHAQDEWLAKTLRAEPSWQLDLDELTITSGGTTLVLIDRKTAEPDLPLEGTRWSVESLIQGEAVSHREGMDKAYLIFKDGKVAGSTGCNSLSGTAGISGTTITFGPIGTTRRGCTGDAASLEKAVLEVLKGSLTFEIDSSSLTLRGAQNGLQLRGS